MQLTIEQLNKIFYIYLKEYVLPGSVNHLKVYEGLNGGKILTTRLFKVLRDPKQNYILQGREVNGEEVARLVDAYLKKNPKIFFVGLNHQFCEKDLDFLIEVYEREFNS